MKFTSNENGQTFEFDLNSKTFHSDAVFAAIEQLKSFRETTKFPKMLEWEIRLYQWIVERPTDAAEKLAEHYLKLRCDLDKPIAAKQLGFNEPFPGKC